MMLSRAPFLYLSYCKWRKQAEEGERSSKINILLKKSLRNQKINDFLKYMCILRNSLMKVFLVNVCIYFILDIVDYSGF